MKTAIPANETPFEELKRKTLEQYEQMSNKIGFYSNLIPKAIEAYDPIRDANKNKLIVMMEELNEVHYRMLNILANNQTNDVIEFIGLKNLEKEYKSDIKQLKSEIIK